MSDPLNLLVLLRYLLIQLLKLHARLLINFIQLLLAVLRFELRLLKHVLQCVQLLL